MEQILEMGMLVSLLVILLALLQCVRILGRLLSQIPSNPQPQKATSANSDSEIPTGVTNLDDAHDLKVEQRVKEDSEWK